MGLLRTESPPSLRRKSIPPDFGAASFRFPEPIETCTPTPVFGLSLHRPRSAERFASSSWRSKTVGIMHVAAPVGIIGTNTNAKGVGVQHHNNCADSCGLDVAVDEVLGCCD
jgi:hypothetical protein